ncbi:MAG: DUF4175 family protein, partial [Planctomycetes bacterium]|nr:DUF4175 family protein [Planctomycetota bacterium]
MNAPAPASLRRQFGRAARRRKLVEIALGASWWLGSVGLAALVLVVIDNLAPLPGALRLVAAPALAVAALVGLWRKVIAPLCASASPESAAQAFERAAGREDNLLINACQFEATTLSPEERTLAAPALIQAQAFAAGLSLRGLLRLRALGLWLLAALVAVGAWFGYAQAFPERCANALARFARPLADIPPLGAWAITTEPAGDSAVAEGSAFTLMVRVRALRDGVPPAAPLAIWREGADVVAVDALAESGSGEKLALSRDSDGRWIAAVPAVRRGFALRVFCGDSCSPSLRVAVMPLPRLASSSFLVTPPAYTGLPATPAAGPPATLSVLPGSTVALSAEIVPAVEELTWQLGGQRIVAAADDGRWAAQATVTTGGTYELASGEVVLVRAALALEQDKPPRVELSGLGDNRLALPGEQLAVTFMAQDDFGLRDLALSVRDSAGGEAWTAKTWSWIGPPGVPTATSSYALVLDPERFQPGHAYVVTAAARDWSDGPAGVSRPAVVRIRAIADIAAVAEADAPAIAALKEAIARQGEAAGLSDNLAAQLVEALANQRLANHRDAIAAKQELAKAAGGAARDAFAKAADAPTAHVLASLVEGEMAVVARDLGALPARTAEQAPGAVATIRDRQRWIHGQLVALLG